ncbi:MAG: sulfotransferase [Desulfobulbaceae bacterium]|nr:sulfotransferase [Desulfobulbaceae bacterium]
MSKPNFFIIGAPKCGTTALSEYLRTHPQVFMCEPKEPHYFADDFACLQYVKEESAYLDLFRAAGPERLAVGEGSVFYLYSPGALKKIKEFQPDARIIIMLRNPVEMLPSYHAQMLYTVVEDVEDFEAAWNLQETRKQQNSIPKGCIDSKLLQYKRWGMFGKNVEQVLAIFPRQNVKIIFFEDFIGNTRSCYLDVLTFLGVRDDGRVEFPAVNERKEHKSRIFGYLVNNRALIAKLSWLASILNKTGISSTAVKEQIKQLNARKIERKPLPDELRERMVSTFRSDIKLLEEITQRDLQHWYAKD